MAGITNSIVIVNCNAKSALLAMLASLRMQESLTTEVLVVDNASFDGSVEAAREEFPQVKWFINKVNLGFWAAANKGIDQAEGDVVIVCHVDLITEIHALDGLADEAREAAGRKVVAVVPRLTSVDESEQPLVGALPGLVSTFMGMIYPAGALKCGTPALDHLADHQWARFVCVAINRNYLETVGAFDEKFFLYCGDTDLCQRILARQMRVLISRDIGVTHAGAASCSQIPAHLLRILKKDQALYAKKHLPAGKMFSALSK